GSYVSWPIALSFVRRVTGLRAAEQLLPAAIPLLATAIMAGAVVLMQRFVTVTLAPATATATLIGVGVMVYCLSLAVFGRQQLQSLAGIARILTGMLRRRSAPRGRQASTRTR